MRLAYDAAYAVTASWSLEFAPVNIAVVFVQARGNELAVIGSRSWFFEELARCLANWREVFPWPVLEHVLPPESSPYVWARMFSEQRLANVVHAPSLDNGERMLVTQRLLSRVSIDTMARPWAPDGNNADLVDSLNGYRVKELASHADVFTTTILPTAEQYLTRALEHYAALDFERSESSPQWAPAPDWSRHDRAVIAGRLAR